MPAQKRRYPHISITLAPEVRAIAEDPAVSRGLPLSTLLAQLLREEAERVRRRAARLSPGSSLVIDGVRIAADPSNTATVYVKGGRR